MADYDLAIIGGGLNGVSIARDAAGRGLRVILLEQGDLGSAASSASPRLVHGDLAVLERNSHGGRSSEWAGIVNRIGRTRCGAIRSQMSRSASCARTRSHA